MLQLLVAIACLSPLLIGGSGVLRGAAAFSHGTDVPRDLDSHFRYLTGIFFATGLGFLSCVPAIERRTARFQLLGALIVVGGVSRGVGMLAMGVPSTGHQIGLAMEIVGVPLLMAWQWRLHSLSLRGEGGRSEATEG